MKHNVLMYSGIPNDTPPERIAPEFILSRPANDFTTLVRPPDFQCLQGFVYIDWKESLSEVSAFIDGIGEREKSSRWVQFY
ncbi:hypothetical protein B0H19DRAFT_1123860, partial [Mycena capillaripes]